MRTTKEMIATSIATRVHLQMKEIENMGGKYKLSELINTEVGLTEYRRDEGIEKINKNIKLHTKEFKMIVIEKLQTRLYADGYFVSRNEIEK